MVPERPLAGLRVLVVEDDYFLAEDLRRALGSAGVTVIGPVASVAQATQQIARDGFDMAVLDLNLRDEMAYALADELKSQKMPFLFVTGYDQSVIPARFADVSRLEKPLEAQRLVAELGRLRSQDPS